MKYASRSQWPRGLRRRSAADRLLRSWVRIPPGAWMFVCCDCCVLSGKGLCDELITRPEESYRRWCVVVCDLETSRMRRSWPALGRSATKKNEICKQNLLHFRHYVPQMEAQFQLRRKFSINFASRNTIVLFSTAIHRASIISSSRFPLSTWPACSKTQDKFRSTQLWTRFAQRYAIYADAVRPKHAA